MSLTLNHKKLANAVMRVFLKNTAEGSQSLYVFLFWKVVGMSLFIEHFFVFFPCGKLESKTHVYCIVFLWPLYDSPRLLLRSPGM